MYKYFCVGILLFFFGSSMEIQAADGFRQAIRKYYDTGVRAVAWHPSDPNKLASVGEEELKIWDVQRGKNRMMHSADDARAKDCACVGCIREELDCTYTAAWNNDGSMLATGGETRLRIWDVSHDVCLRDGKVTDAALLVKYSPDGKQMAVALSSGIIHIYDVREKRLISSIFSRVDIEHECIRDMDFSPDGSQLAIAAYDLHVLDLKTRKVWICNDFADRKGKPLTEYKSVSWSPERLLVSALHGIRAKDEYGVKPILRIRDKEPLRVAQYGDRIAVAHNNLQAPYDSIISLLTSQEKGIDSVVGTKHMRTKENGCCYLLTMGFNASGEQIAASDTCGRIHMLPVEALYNAPKGKRHDVASLKDEKDDAESDSCFESGHKPFSYSFSGNSGASMLRNARAQLRRTQSAGPAKKS